MALAHVKEFDSIFANGGVGVLAGYGFFARHQQGNQVDVGRVQDFYAKVQSLKTDRRYRMQPIELSAALGCPTSAVMNLFCKSKKGADRYGVEIETRAAHDLLMKFLTPKA